MKLYAPKYYRDFACIAQRCAHNCCIGWEIDIDQTTAKRYRSFQEGYGKEIKKSIARGLSPHFELTEQNRCPHLDQRGLCRIITELGESYLCEICREHPRFYHDTQYRKEVGIGMACEEACRLILSTDDYQTMEEVGELDQSQETAFDSVVHRENIYNILSNATVPYIRRIERMQEVYRISPAMLSDGEWQGLLWRLEYLNEENRKLFSEYTSQLFVLPQAEKSLERVLAYLIFRHCSDRYDEEEVRVALGFCLFCERLLACVIRREKADQLPKIVQLARALSEELEYSEENTQQIQTEFRERI